jgi:hypothetical protein
MKKVIYLLIILISYSSYGQIGISYDFGLNYMSDSAANETGLHYNAAIGGVYSMQMSEKLNLEVGANVSIPYYLEFDLSYGEVYRPQLRTSALAKYYLGETFSLKGGLVLGYRFNDYDDEYGMRNGSLAVSLGVGWDITEKFVISIGSILPLTNESKPSDYSAHPARNYSFGFGLQYFFF